MGMVPLCDEAIDRVLARDDEQAHRSVSLRHALIHRSPGLWGDHPRRPRSVVLVREDDGPEGRHAFGLGEAEPAVGWLSRLGRRVSLLAPTAWEGAIRRRGSAVLRGIVETWVRSPGDDGTDRRRPARSRGGSARSTSRRSSSPRRSWRCRAGGRSRGSSARARRSASPTATAGCSPWRGPSRPTTAATPWPSPPSPATAGSASAARAGSALVAHVEAVRGKEPIWTVADENLASKALARSLGFSPRVREVVLRWGP